LVKHHGYEFHAPAAFITLEDVDFESAFEKLCPWTRAMGNGSDLSER